ncbi:MAG: MotA/TolQ/ExbB proton channel family protein [Candidatus Cloacimonetes bacterium]|nr:MotA/TolQ/ExbB proton channel family protein [Candidatus Cloacimonadota bacterium]
MSKRFFIILMIMAFAIFTTVAFAQEEVVEETTSEEISAEGTAVDEIAEEEAFEESPQSGGMEMFARKIVGSGLVDLFIQGGFVMYPMLLLLIWGIATIIWKIISLSYAKVNLKEFLDKIVPLVESKKYNDAIKLCEETKGPVAAIMHLGLLKVDKGIEAVEKAIENAGVIEMAFLEKGFIPLSTTINLAPMFGFFGTIVGMIRAFRDIAAAGEVEPTIVANGIEIALITTAAGLAIAIPMQFFNNMFLGMVDGLVMDMQRGSEKLVETLVENK